MNSIRTKDMSFSNKMIKISINKIILLENEKKSHTINTYHTVEGNMCYGWEYQEIQEDFFYTLIKLNYID